MDINGLSRFNFLNRINRDFRINFCYVKMKKKKKRKEEYTLWNKKKKAFFFEREFFPDISLTDLIKNFGTKKKRKNRSRTRGTNGKERREERIDRSSMCR